MNKYPLFLLVFSAHFSFAQITITSTDLPSAGDTLRVSYSSDSLDPVLTGPNYTWDFSYLVPNAQWVEKFDSPSTFVSPFNLLFGSWNTSYGQAQYTPDSIPGIGIAMDNAYGFFKKSSASLNQNGLGLSLNAIPIPFMYSPQDVIYKFPVNYGNVDSCDSEFGPPSIVPLPFYYGQKIHRVNEVDGWGTLITPYGTFASLRIKSTLAIRDTFADSSGMGFTFPRPLQYEFKWLKSGGKVPYLQVNAVDAAGTPTVTQISYRDSMRAGVIGIGINEMVGADYEFSVYPNPAGHYVLLEYRLSENSTVRAEISDINGKKVLDGINRSQSAGKHVEVIDLSRNHMGSGVYLITVTAGNRVGHSKLIVR
jgi:hypothetical protein